MHPRPLKPHYYSMIAPFKHLRLLYVVGVSLPTTSWESGPDPIRAPCHSPAWSWKLGLSEEILDQRFAKRAKSCTMLKLVKAECLDAPFNFTAQAKLITVQCLLHEFSENFFRNCWSFLTKRYEEHSNWVLRFQQGYGKKWQLL